MRAELSLNEELPTTRPESAELPLAAPHLQMNSCVLVDPDGRNGRTRRRGQTPLRGSLETGAEIQSALVGGNATLRKSAN